ncbi:hypothetical protein D5F01_LYC16955 [Larimichthys crocea]|uniref:LINE-1 type transposase domain-containing protein 1 n=1 Tax=Larimichthys crocea TaxID=215358 RepID=A0A6G0I2C6_LARCR|nr:hypothetical protein D5F01_LYC16955 [Larimichthys crocea]
MASGTRLAKERKTAKDDSFAMANQISMPALTSLLEEHRKSISAALSTELRSAFASLEAKLDTVQATVIDFEACIKLKNKNIDLEGRSRRNKIRIVDLPEAIEGPRPTSFFLDVLMEIFGDQVLQTPPKVDRAHRSLAAKPRQGDQPRPVIVCLHWHQTKELIVREARKRRNNLKYRDVLIRIYEDYCPKVVEQRAVYRDVMAKLYNLGLRPALRYLAKLQITQKNGTKKCFSSVEKADAFAGAQPTSCNR